MVETRVPSRPSGGNRDYGGTVLGGIVGGVVGNQFGKGMGAGCDCSRRSPPTRLSVARYDNRGGDGRPADRDEYEEREIRRCRQVNNWESRVTGYRVTARICWPPLHHHHACLTIRAGKSVCACRWSRNIDLRQALART